ncbi:hypothetical protein AMS68_003091 [Peltaster fructicola]|uniref:Uncharacterized protein n=1 Tax=Peltaster fructicola TaxID=286661 RepID=A0A6H0XS62_9PEZI|nr:hypothetical protein AMS68_003091 [Peltaster fructicola]
MTVPSTVRTKTSEKASRKHRTSVKSQTNPLPATPSWKSLFAFTKREDVPVLIVASLCSIIASAASPGQAYITGKVFDGFVQFASQSIDAETLIEQQRKWILYLVGIACASWSFHSLEMATWMTFGELQARNARADLFQGLSNMDIAWYDLCEDGIQAFLPRSQTHIKELQLATSQPLGGLLSLASTSLIALGQAFYNSWDLTLVTLAGAPLIAAAIIYFGLGMQKAIDHQQSYREDAQKRLLETLSNIETVKCFNAQEMECERYLKDVCTAAYWYRKIVHTNAIQMAVLGFLVQAMFVQAFYYGGTLIKSGKKQSSQVITTFFSAITAFQAIQSVIPQIVVLEKGRFAGAALRSGMPSTSNHMSDRQSYTPSECKGHIQLKSVSFSYPSRPQQLALDNVSLVLPAGDLTFLIGKSGSGKSTIGQLLVRFYDANTGTVLLGGENLLDLDRQWLRSNITLVEQTSTLFEGTIHSNIALGCRNQSGASEDVHSAVEFALLQRMVADMPKGLDTNLGQRGDSISGGQRQRIALARARLRDTPILILDESTSALDQISRELMMDAIRLWRRDRTTIIVTHDISQIRPDDYAIILERGRVVQEGYRQHMEECAGSPFSAFIVGDSLVSDAAEHVLIRNSAPRPRSRRRPTSFFSAASVCIDTLPFHSLSLSAVQNNSVFSSAQLYGSVRHDSENDDSAERRMTEDDRTLAQRMQDFMQDSGQWALANRVAATKRRGHGKQSIEPEPVRQTDEGEHGPVEAYSSLLGMLWQMRRELPAAKQALLLLGYLGGTVHAACSPVFAYVLAKLLALYSQPGDTSHQSIAYALAILGVAGVDAICIFLYRYCVELASQAWIDTLRKHASRRLLAQPQEFHELTSNAASVFVDVLDHQAEEMRNLFGRFIVMLYSAAVVLLIAFFWAMSTDWKLTLVAMTAPPYIFVVASIYTRVSEKWERFSNDASQGVNVVFMEAFIKVRTVRTLLLEQYFYDKFAAASARTLKTGCRRACLSGFFYGLSNSSGVLATALVFYIGTKLVHDGTSVVAAVQVFTIIIMTIANVTAVLDYVPQMGSSKEMSERVLKLAELPNESHESTGDMRISSVGRIQFTRLDFAYPGRPDALVLKDVTFELRSGLTTAVVGGSGSGKSTVAKLLLKLYPTGTDQRCGLSVSGRAISLINTEALRGITAVVAQTSALFSATIEANIIYGLTANSPLATMANVIIASKQAGIYDFVSSLPDGFKTMVGPGGVGLSGGQIQRIAIARALVRSPSLLILDEATSALDATSAAQVRDTIRHLVRFQNDKMTILMITHNREMMEIADQVVVLDHGCVVECGRYTTLLNSGGHLTNLLRGGAID